MCVANIQDPGPELARSGSVLLYCCRSQVCVSICLIPEGSKQILYQLWSDAVSLLLQEKMFFKQSTNCKVQKHTMYYFFYLLEHHHHHSASVTVLPLGPPQFGSNVWVSDGSDCPFWIIYKTGMVNTSAPTFLNCECCVKTNLLV